MAGLVGRDIADDDRIDDCCMAGLCEEGYGAKNQEKLQN
jgi:hypothetical protein